ncbi:hypothetical protein HY734_00550 [Candidatus Uhrbacteria bacterium]|nr:hypothetical protein [Candidatus Uhrbacteria bacterium]
MQRNIKDLLGWRGVYDVDFLKRQQAWLDRCGDADLVRLNDALDRVRFHRGALIREYAWPIALKFEPVSEMHNARFEELLRRGYVHGDGSLKMRRRFEAGSLFLLASAYSHIELVDSERNVRDDLLEFMDFLSSKLFLPDSEEITVWTKHNPRKHFRVDGVTINTNLWRRSRYVRENEVVCRLLSDGTYVIFLDRGKLTFDTILKTGKQVINHESGSKKDPYHIRDRRGMRLVFPTWNDADRFATRLEQLITSFGGSFLRRKSNIEGNGRMEQENRHSSPDFKAIKCAVVWEGKSLEILLMAFEEYFTSTLSTGNANHELYRLGQLLDVYFPSMLFPAEVYRSVRSWKNLAIRRLLIDYQVSRLGWRTGHRS